MNIYPVAYILSILLFGNVCFQFIPIFVAGIYKEFSLMPSLFLSLGVSLVIPILLLLPGLRAIYPKRNLEFSHKESFLIVSGAWFFMALAGAFPFYFTGVIPSFTDAFFESISGYTTTGASILTNIEALPKSLLLWRSFTHWIGGMGIMVFTLALLPALGIGGLQMFKAEVPGPIPDKLAPQVKQTAKILWKVYLVITIIQVVLLLIAGLDLFDALNHAFATLATGGFSTKNNSIAHFSPMVQWIIFLFMVIAGTNFSLHYRFYKGDLRAYFRDAEFRFYFIGLIAFSSTIILYVLIYHYFTGNSTPGFDSFGEIARHTFFQVASLVTTTGFASADYEKWPDHVQVILFIVMFFGGCAGSTGGGIKQMRIFVLIKIAIDEIKQLIHPRGIFNAKIGSNILRIEVQKSIFAFVIIYILIFIIAVAVISLWDIDLVTSLTASLASIGNIGPGLGLVGPTDNYAWLPSPVKWILSFLMLLGRLEIFPVVVLLAPSTWKK